MRISNNNTGILKKITSRLIKINKLRNAFLILAIAITTFMLTSVFTLCVSAIKNYEVFTNRVFGTTANIVLSNPTAEQIEQIANISIIKETGLVVKCGEVLNQDISDNKNVLLYYYNKDCYENFIKPVNINIQGNYPEVKNEIMLSEESLKNLNQENAVLGDVVKINFLSKGTEKSEEFIITGIFSESNLNNDSSYIYVSEEFANENDFYGNKDGGLYMDTTYLNRQNAVEILSNEIALENNQIIDYTFDENLESYNRTVFIISIVLSTFFIFSGFLLIYNVMYISVIKDINFYGLIKTIGTSPTQIKKIVNYQAYILALIGIPIGIALAYLFSFNVIKMIFEIFFSGERRAIMPTDIYFSPLTIGLIILFVLLTIKVSCHTPSKIASKVTPVEAVKYTGVKSKKNKHIRKTTSGGKLYKMAWYNLFRDRKRAFVVFLSLFVGIMTYLCSTMLINAIGIEEYMNTYYPSDFAIYNNDYNVHVYEKNSGDIDYLSDENVEKLSKLTGVTEVQTRKIGWVQLEISDELFFPVFLERAYGYREEDRPVYYENMKSEKDFVETTAIYLSDDRIESIYNRLRETFDIEAFKRGEVALFYSADCYEEATTLENTVTVKNIENTNSQVFTPVIVEQYDIAFALGTSTYMEIPIVIMSENLINKFNPNAKNFELLVDCLPEYELELGEYLTGLLEEKNLDLIKKSDAFDVMNITMAALNSVGFGISGILILVGLLNFINTIVTGITSRRQELGLLEAIGMTRKQIIKMLVLEGVYYILVTGVFVFTVGTVIMGWFSKFVELLNGYSVVAYPFGEVIFLMSLILFACIITPIISYKLLPKESIVDRIR